MKTTIADHIVDEPLSIWAALPDSVGEVSIRFIRGKGIELHSDLGYELIPVVRRKEPKDE